MNELTPSTFKMRELLNVPENLRAVESRTDQSESKRTAMIRYIREHSGEHISYSDLGKATNTSNGNAHNHVKILRKQGIVSVNVMGGKHYFFYNRTPDQVNISVNPIEPARFTDTSGLGRVGRTVIEYLREHPNKTSSQIANGTNLTSTQVQQSVSILHKSGRIIRHKLKGKMARFSALPAPEVQSTTLTRSSQNSLIEQAFNYVKENPGASMSDIAAHFGRSREELGLYASINTQITLGTMKSIGKRYKQYWTTADAPIFTRNVQSYLAQQAAQASVAPEATATPEVEPEPVTEAQDVPHAEMSIFEVTDKMFVDRSDREVFEYMRNNNLTGSTGVALIGYANYLHKRYLDETIESEETANEPNDRTN